MSIELPIYDDRILGSEYQKILESSRDRGLQDPIRKNPIIDYNNNEYSLDLGLRNPNILLQNNDNPEETQQYTDAQALLNLQKSGSLNKPMSYEERELVDFVDSDLDSNLRMLLVNESNRMGDNIYAQDSQDFVNQIREDIQSYNYENNLYLQQLSDVQQLLQALQQQKEQQQEQAASAQTVGDVIAKSMMEKEKEKEQETKKAFEERKRFVKPSEPRLEEQLERDTSKDKFNKPAEKNSGVPNKNKYAKKFNYNRFRKAKPKEGVF